MAASSGKLLTNVGFPVFIIESVGQKYFVVGGGGGPSATGVPNGLEIFELVSDEKTKELSAKTICKHTTDKYAVMNCGIVTDSLNRVHLACGHDDKCFVYTIKQKVVTPRADSPDGRLRKRKGVLTQADDFKNAKKIVTFDVQLMDSVQTDFHPEDAYQNSAVFAPDASSLATGGADGHIRVWKYPELNKLLDIEAHEMEVDAMHIDPTGKLLCSTSKDNKLFLWELSSGKQLSELKWASDPPVKYKHKAVRFCHVNRDPNQACLFSLETPVVHKKGMPCYISQWNINKYKPILVQATKQGTLACMDVSDCGKYIGTGTMEGGIAVYSTADLSCVYSVSAAHKTFVTGVNFTPSALPSQLITNDARFTLLSISIDNQVKVHQPPKPSWTKHKILIFFLVLLIMALVQFILLSVAVTFTDYPV